MSEGWAGYAPVAPASFRPVAAPPPPQVDHRPGPLGALRLVDEAPHAVPGHETVCMCQVRNLQTVIDELHVDVGGPAAAFGAVDPASVVLFPDDVGELQIRFTPPVNLTAEGVPFWVRVVSSVDPTSWAAQEGTLWIAQVPAVAGWLKPATVADRRGGRHELVLRNVGNAPTIVDVAAADPDGVLRFEIKGAAGIELGLGQEKRLRVEYRCAVRHRGEEPLRRPFAVHLTPRGGVTEVVEGCFIQRAR